MGKTGAQYKRVIPEDPRRNYNNDHDHNNIKGGLTPASPTLSPYHPMSRTKAAKPLPKFEVGTFSLSPY